MRCKSDSPSTQPRMKFYIGLGLVEVPTGPDSVVLEVGLNDVMGE